MRAALALVVAGCLAACSAPPADDVASAQMALSTTSDLAPSDVAAVEILVFDGATGGCARVLAGASPLDDSGLVVVAHALFTVDGTPKHLAIPAGKPLDFYAEAFATTAPGRMRIGRGCVTETLAAGSSTAVSIVLGANSD
jgi:hypothetical protein